MKFRITLLKAVAFVGMIAFSSCEKDDGAIPNRVSIEDVPVITTNLTKNNGTLDTIFLSNAAAYQGSVKIALFFPDKTPPAKIDVVIRKNAANASTRVFQADVTGLPATITITAAQLVTLFGAPLASTETYDVAPDIYVGAKKYQAFPLVGLGNGQGVTGMSTIGFGEYVRVRIRP